MPLRLPLPEGVYTDVPYCWWSRARWLAHVEALYETHYKRLRDAGEVPSVGKSTFMLTMAGMAIGADAATGRECRVPVGTVRRNGTRTGLVDVVGRSRRQVQRAREIARKLCVVSDVQQGRRRSLTERLESYERGDRSRGWCTVSVLHESTALPVDNSRVDELHDQGNVTPLLRSSGSLSTSFKKMVTTDQTVKHRGASRRHDKAKGRKRAAAFDPKALVLASKCKQNAQMPPWVRRSGVKALAAVLTRPARHGWGDDDVLEALRERALAQRLLPNPSNAFAYLASILAGFDLDSPPAADIKAHAAAVDEARRREQRLRKAELALRPTCAVPSNSPARLSALAEARAIDERAAEHRAARRRQANEELAALVARARK